jgi:pimeloyl-ACP methyl ester carboxylesterase
VRSTGSVARYRDWLVEDVLPPDVPVVLGGHSMGAAVAVLAAGAAPERVSHLVLVAPSGLPLAKPVARIVFDFLRNVAAGRFHAADVLPPLGDTARHPLAAARLARTLRRLDLSPHFAAVRAAGVRSTVIGCKSDTLTPPVLTRRIAELLGADYRELDIVGGHAWMFGAWDVFARELGRSTYATASSR